MIQNKRLVALKGLRELKILLKNLTLIVIYIYVAFLNDENCLFIVGTAEKKVGALVVSGDFWL